MWLASSDYEYPVDAFGDDYGDVGRAAIGELRRHADVGASVCGWVARMGRRLIESRSS